MLILLNHGSRNGLFRRAHIPGAAAHLRLCICLWLAFGGGVHAQQANREDDVINAMRHLPAINASDQRRIADWVERQVKKFTPAEGGIDFTTFRDRFTAQYGHLSNSQQFRLQLAAQTAQVAAKHFGMPNLRAGVAFSLASVLTNMNRLETLPGLIAGLKSSDARARYMCAKGLASQKRLIAADKAKLDQTLRGLRAAGEGESDPVVLGRIYEALAFPGQPAAVVDSYVKLFDKRLALRRGPAVIVDGAEIYAYEFLRIPGVVNALDTGRKSGLVVRLAVFLRMDAERYSFANLHFDEIDRIERSLEHVEAILSSVAGNSEGGRIRDALSAGGHGNRQAVLLEAYRWVGDPNNNTPGALNEAPWNVPVGAP